MPDRVKPLQPTAVTNEEDPSPVEVADPMNLEAPSRRMLVPRLIALLRQAGSGSAFRKRVSLTLATNAILGVIGLATGVMAARLLGPEGRGELASIQAWPLLLASLAMIGMPEALVYFVSRTPERAGQYLASALVMVFVAGAVAVVIGWWFMPLMLKAQSPATIEAARRFLPIIAIYALVGLPHQLFRALGRWKAWNLLRILPSIFWMFVLTFACFSARLANLGF